MNLKAKFLVFCSTILIHSVLGVVQSPPRIIDQPHNGELLFQAATNAIEHVQPLVLKCEAEGEPVPKYRWTKNGENVNWQAYDGRISQDPGRGTVIVQSPRNEDEGQYQCFAENEWGTATSNSVFVRRAELNSFEDAPPTVKEAREGEPFKLSCQPPYGWPKPNVEWVTQRSSGRLYTIKNNPRITSDPEGNLWFSNVTMSDASGDSLYACAAASAFRFEVKLGNKIILRVIETDSASGQNKIAPVQQYVTRKEEVAIRNKTAKLYCIYGGTPLPQTVWSKNGRPLPLNATNHISRGSHSKRLQINYVTQEDEGNYTCEVSNGVGEPISYTINLRVLAEPYFTQKPKDVHAAEGEDVELLCKASGNPEPEIRWIYNGKPISDAPVNPRRTVSTNSIVISRLQKSDIGNYGCNATNSLGYVYKDVSVNVLGTNV